MQDQNLSRMARTLDTPSRQMRFQRGRYQSSLISPVVSNLLIHLAGQQRGEETVPDLRPECHAALDDVDRRRLIAEPSTGREKEIR